MHEFHKFFWIEEDPMDIMEFNRVGRIPQEDHKTAAESRHGIVPLALLPQRFNQHVVTHTCFNG